MPCTTESPKYIEKVGLVTQNIPGVKLLSSSGLGTLGEVVKLFRVKV